LLKSKTHRATISTRGALRHLRRSWRAWQRNHFGQLLCCASASVGDLLIIAAFGPVSEERVRGTCSKLVFVDRANCTKEERADIPVQQASGEPALT